MGRCSFSFLKGWRKGGDELHTHVKRFLCLVVLGNKLRLSGPPLDFHDKYSNIDRYGGRPGSCQLCLLAALINCFMISHPAGGPLLDHFCPPSGRRMEQAAECLYRQPPCAERVPSLQGTMNSFRHLAASWRLCRFICMLWRLNWDG